MTLANDTLFVSVTPGSVVAGSPIAYPSNVFASSDLIVYYDDDKVAVLDTDYTVNLSDPGFKDAEVVPTVAFVAALSGTTADVIIRRNMDFLQPVDLTINSKFPETQLEKFMDQTAARFLQVQDQFARSLLASPGQANKNLVLPVSEEGKALVWDVSGDLVNSTSDLTDLDSAITAAEAAQTAAESAANAALAAFDDFDDRYLGEKASPPTLDNDGDPLVAGALYFDTSFGEMQVYSGSTWSAVAGSLSAALSSINSLTPAADRVPYYTGATTAALATLTAAGRAMIAAADAPAQAAIIQPHISAGGIDAVNIVTFEAGGTYTPTAGMVFAKVRAVGPGANGAPGGTAGSALRRGGGSGTYGEKFVTAAQIGANQTVTIGAGNSGNDTSLGALLVCPGADPDGGTTQAAVATGADFELQGTPGDNFDAADQTTAGRDSPMGRGGISTNTGPGADATGYGSGGASGKNDGSSAERVAGDGAGGQVFIEEYIATP